MTSTVSLRLAPECSCPACRRYAAALADVETASRERRHARQAYGPAPRPFPLGHLSRELRHTAAASDRAHAGSSSYPVIQRLERGPHGEGGPALVGSANWSPNRAAIDPACDRWPAMAGPQQAVGVEAGDRVSEKERSPE